METKEALQVAAAHIIKSELYARLSELGRRRVLEASERKTSDLTIELRPANCGPSVYMHIGYDWGERLPDQNGDVYLVQRRSVTLNWGTQGASSTKDSAAMLKCYTGALDMALELEKLLPEFCRTLLRTKAQVDADNAEEERKEAFRRHEEAKSLAVSRVSKCMRVRSRRDLGREDLRALKESGLALAENGSTTKFAVEDGDKMFELSVGIGFGWAEVSRVR